jgi:hypothetical protein
MATAPIVAAWFFITPFISRVAKGKEAILIPCLLLSGGGISDLVAKVIRLFRPKS